MSPTKKGNRTTRSAPRFGYNDPTNGMVGKGWTMSVQESGRPRTFHRRRRRAVLTASLVVGLFISPATNVAASEGKVTGGALLSCSQEGTVVVSAYAENGTDASVDVKFIVLGDFETKPVPAGSGESFEKDSGSASITDGSVSFEVNGSSGTVFYGPMTCPSSSKGFGPIDLYIAPDPGTTPVVETDFTVFANCDTVYVNGFIAEATASVAVTVGGNTYFDEEVQGGDLFLTQVIDPPVYGTAIPVEASVGGLTKSAEIEQCDAPETTGATATTTAVSTTASTAATTSASPTPTLPVETTTPENTSTSMSSSVGATTGTTAPTTTPEQTCTAGKQHLLTKGPYVNTCVDNEPGDWPPSDGSSSFGSAPPTPVGATVTGVSAVPGLSGGSVGSNGSANSSGFNGSQPLDQQFVIVDPSAAEDFVFAGVGGAG